ncbi:MAG: TonB-dependent receptor [Tannerellaceae bacterium]|jgi:TonB-linked SusC/RagA family outer membrane protein|nr:TonB-dependent receptor [Tannerellaceae bacterium]
MITYQNKRFYSVRKGKEKITFICIIFFLFTIPAPHRLHAQTNRITLSLENVNLKTFFDAIEKQSSYTFTYRDIIVEDNNDISLKVTNQTVEQVLNRILPARRLQYSISGNSIQVTKTTQQAVKRVSGSITDPFGDPIIGANVVEKGTTNGTVTDMDGKFTLEVQEGTILQISYIGFLAKEQRVDSRQNYSILLTEDSQNIEEVVVVGYGIQKKVSTTSAVAQLKSEELTVRPVSNTQQALQGLSPGLTITDEGGAPGRSTAKVRVRGITTLITEQDGRTIGSNDPLVLVDGVEQRFEDINPNDIESISILKDAASSAIYGSRAANGVILVTTKRAKAGEIRVNYNGFFSLGTPQNTPEHMDVIDYMRYQNMAYINSGAEPIYTEERIKEYQSSNDRIKYPLPNDYMDIMYRNALLTDNSVSISGGSDTYKGLLSLRHQDNDGILSSYKYKMTGIRINTDYNKGIFSLNADADYRYNFSKEPLNNVINYIYHGSQWAVPQYPDDTYGLSKQGNNPMILNDIAGDSNLRKYYFVGNLKLDVQLSKDLKITAQYSTKVTNDVNKKFSNAYKILDYDDKSVVKKNVDKNNLTEVRENMNEQTFTGLINYGKTIGAHEFSALAGYSEIVNKRNYLEGYREYFYNNEMTSMDMGGQDNRKISGYDHEWGLRSFFGRVNYNFHNRYLFDANARWDGSSRFTGSGVYAFFPSLSAAWRVSQEEFWRENEILNDLKIRGSWGKTGNQAIPLYEFYPALVTSNYTYENLIATGYIQEKMSNKDLTWETTTQTNVGLDAYLFNSRMNITFDFYNKITDGILLKLPIPSVIGLLEPLQNAGSVRNRGIELMLSWRDTYKEISYHVTANMAMNKNMILDLAGSGPYKTTSSTDPMTIRQEGLPIDSHWGYKTDGLFQTQEEVDKYPTLFANSKPGDVKYIDLNDDGEITPEDMTYLGNTFPKYTFGLNGSITWKNFELYMQWQGTADVDVRLTGALIEMGNQEGFTHNIYTNNVWTPENTNARFPRPVKFDLRNVHSSDRVIFDGSYLRLKTLQLSYTLPLQLTRKAFIQKAKVSVSATNLLTFSALNEWNLDPEIPSGRANYYPQTSVYSLGLNLEF